MDLSSFITVAGLIRIVIGLAPILGARVTARWLGFPDEHDNPTARLMGRLFGVRDIGLGVIAFGALAGKVDLGFALLFNAATDLADVVMIAVPLARRDCIDRPALLSLSMAAGGGLVWVALWSMS